MTRIFAATAILICLAFSFSDPARSDGSRNLATDNGCFPWQDYRNGQCVAKPSQAPPPLPEPGPAAAPPSPPPLNAAPSPPLVCPEGASNDGGRCLCPTRTHLEGASGRCVADIGPRQPEPAIVCDGGTLADGACACPQGYDLMPAAGNAAGGTCARANADNCLGGELTVSGKCICSGQVTMDGETYLLEYSRGKCLPMRCPIGALHDGKCGSTTTSAQPSAEPGRLRPTPEQARDASDEDEHRRHCAHGMVVTRSGCVPARRRPSGWEESARRYYRNYYPGPATPPF
ncbi:MAG: hypothetical protein JOZ74_12490 [Bradyrhizobium sp.]|nr:hypothetical protein [Bradyrhizobium sp.]